MHLQLLRIRVKRLDDIEINREQQGCSWADVSAKHLVEVYGTMGLVRLRNPAIQKEPIQSRGARCERRSHLIASVFAASSFVGCSEDALLAALAKECILGFVVTSRSAR